MAPAIDAGSVRFNSFGYPVSFTVEPRKQPHTGLFFPIVVGSIVCLNAALFGGSVSTQHCASGNIVDDPVAGLVLS